ncbi:histone-lysine N-methyltransferase SETMAR [Elysia marginata]|uniref:Histone-lysine N-methyltransferase SETMAR n=1 Tax=Elysia marginata TaxID=1093978 RepID=A0AAV4II81_9GAST|nr:histone-lysine N-methyltransferase SETMAR [Elysia marginata]
MWVPRMLTDEMKMQRKTTCAELLKYYEEEGEECIHRIVTGDESWMHHYDPESKRQSMKYRHKSSPSPRAQSYFCQKNDADCILGLRGNCS